MSPLSLSPPSSSPSSSSPPSSPASSGPPLDPVQLARRAFAFYALGDRDGVLSCVHAAGEFRFHGEAPGVPWAGLWRGAEIGRFIDLVVDLMEFQEIRVEQVFACGDAVFLRVHERHLARATGRTLETSLIGQMTVRDGAVVAYEEWNDTAAIERALA